MSVPQNIQELANKVRNEIYGKDVRESIAKSMEATGEVAEWSRQVAQDIVDGKFDEGELATEIERKLNDLEVQYAPELNSVKTDLAQTASNKLDKSEANKIKNENNIEVQAMIIELNALRSIISTNYASSIEEGISTGLAE